MRLISRSASRKLVVTVVTMAGIVLLYEATMWDSRDAAEVSLRTEATLFAGTKLPFAATAYCKGTTTASGVKVRTGIAAADTELLPVGSVISLATGDAKYNGIYTIMDTGPRVQGRTIDLYMWSCHEALAFGRQQAQLTVLRLGWNPRATAQNFIDTLFRRRQVPARTTTVPPLRAAEPSAVGHDPAVETSEEVLEQQTIRPDTVSPHDEKPTSVPSAP